MKANAKVKWIFSTRRSRVSSYVSKQKKKRWVSLVTHESRMHCLFGKIRQAVFSTWNIIQRKWKKIQEIAQQLGVWIEAPCHSNRSIFSCQSNNAFTFGPKRCLHFVNWRITICKLTYGFYTVASRFRRKYVTKSPASHWRGWITFGVRSLRIEKWIYRLTAT